MSASARFFAIALGLGLLMRLGFVLLAGNDPAILMHHDQLGYIQLADVILSGGGLGTAFGAERMPIYPLFLAACAWLAPGGGETIATFGTDALVLAVVLQNLLGLSTIYCMYRIGLLFNQATANLCGAFAALNLNMAVYSSQILTDSLFYPLFTGALFLFFLYRESGRVRHLALLAAALGAATLVRSVTMFLPLFVLPYLLIERNGTGIVERGKRAVVFTVLFAALLAPWLMRNHSLYGHAKLHTQGQAHIAGWVIPGIAQYEKGIALDTATKQSMDEWRTRVETMPEAEREDGFARDAEAKRWFGEYLAQVSPVSVAKAWFWGAVKNVFTPVSVELAYVFQMEWTHFYETPGASFPEQAVNFVFKNENRMYAMLLVAGIGLTLLFRLVQLTGAWRLFRAKPGLFVLCLMTVGYYLAVSGPVGYAKYRLPFEPVFILLTALAVGMVPAFKRDREEGDAPFLRAMGGTVFRVVLAGGCILYAVWGIDFAGLGRAVSSLALPGILMVSVVLVLDFACMGLRLRTASGGRVDFVRGFNGAILGHGMNNIFPAKLGEAAKTIYLMRASGRGLGECLGWVFWERFGDLNMLLAFALAAAVGTGLGGVAWPMAVVVGSMWIGLFLLARWDGFIVLAERLVLFSALRRLVRDLAGSMRTTLHRGFLLRVLAVSFLVWTAYYLQYVFLLRFGAELDLSLAHILVVFVMAAGGMAIPSTPGAVGVFEAVMVAALSLFGVPREQALAVGIVFHMMLYIPSTLYALGVFARTGLSLNLVRRGVGGDDDEKLEAGNV